MVGLTRMINKNHICRAVLEATAYQTYDVFDAMRKLVPDVSSVAVRRGREA